MNTRLPEPLPVFWHLKPVCSARDENCLIVPGTARLGPFARLLFPFVLPDGKGEAWLKHNIEEMGTLETFWPEL